MERITQAASITHHEEPSTSLKALCHCARHRFKQFGVSGKKLLLHLDALATLANDLVAKAFRCFVYGSVGLIGCAHIILHFRHASEGPGAVRTHNKPRMLLPPKPLSRREDAAVCTPCRRPGNRAAF